MKLLVLEKFPYARSKINIYSWLFSTEKNLSIPRQISVSHKHLTCKHKDLYVAIPPGEQVTRSYLLHD